MPKIQWENLPKEKWAHLRDRAKERKVSMQDLFELASWKSQDPDVPDGTGTRILERSNFVGRTVPKHFSYVWPVGPSRNCKSGVLARVLFGLANRISNGKRARVLKTT